MARLLPLTALAFAAATAATPVGAQPSPYAGPDRYGPVSGPAPAASYGYAQAAPAAPPPLRGRVLMWPGKIALRTPAPAPQSAYAPPGYASPAAGRGAWTSAYANPGAPLPRSSAQAPVAPAYPQYAAPPPQAYAQPATYSAATSIAPAPGWRPVFAPTGIAQGATVQRSAPPASYAAPGQGYLPTFAADRAAPPNRAFAADRRYGYDPTQNHSVRFYSVSRPFGLKPDPAPIPPQFFTATADLSGGDPPGPLPVNHTTAATRAAVVGGDSGGQ